MIYILLIISVVFAFLLFDLKINPEKYLKLIEKVRSKKKD